MCIPQHTVTTHLCGHRTGVLGAGKGNKKLFACDRVLSQHRAGASRPIVACLARRKRTVVQVTYPCERCVEVGEWRMHTDNDSWMHTPRTVATTVAKMVDSVWMVEELDASVQGPAEAAADVVSTLHHLLALRARSVPSATQPQSTAASPISREEQRRRRPRRRHGQDTMS